MQSVVTELSKQFTYSIKVVKKPAMSFVDRRHLNTFPSLAINDTVVFKGRGVSVEELESAIVKEMAKTEHLP